MDALSVTLLFCGFLLLFLALGLVAAEEAFSNIHAVKVDSLEEKNAKRAKKLAGLVDDSRSTGNMLRLLSLITQLSQVSLITYLSLKFLDAPWSVLVIGCNAILVFVIAEAVPRTLGILYADKVAFSLASPVALLLRIQPIRALSDGLIALTNTIVPGEGLQQGPFKSPEDLIALADAAVEDDVLEQSERDLIESVIEFSDTIVREVMVPRTDMTTVEKTASVEQALEIASVAGFSRLPAVGQEVDDVVGLVYVKDLIKAEINDETNKKIVELLRPSRFVPESKKVAELLKEMQKDKFHMAVAVDEYGGIAGLVTLEDLIEEILGEIVDEYDTEEPLVERQRDGSLKVDARISIDELNDLAEMSLPEGPWDTVGGLVFDRFGKVPAVGDNCEVDGYLLRVEKVQGRRISRVRLRALEEKSVTEDD